MPRERFILRLATSMHHCLCLGVEVVPVREGASCQEVVLDIGKVSLHPGLSICIAHGMGDKPDPEDLAKVFHLRGDLCIGTAAMGHDHRGIVDGAPGACAIHEEEGFPEKDLGLEAGEGWVILDKELSGVGKDQAGALGLYLFPSQDPADGGRCRAASPDPGSNS